MFVPIGGRPVGEGHPVFIIAEIGINHNGSVEIAKRLIDAAAFAGCDAVKFQKRTPELCVPEDQRDVLRETPWGMMTYLEYRRRIELDEEAYRHLAQYAANKGLIWFASCWDEVSVDVMEQVGCPCYKIPSAAITDEVLLRKIASTGKPIIMSTGMSTLEEIDRAVELLPRDRLLVAHCTSTYPCPPEELNLRMIPVLKERYNVPIGYSGHEVGLQTTIAAVALGAVFVERHITLDRAMWGSDQAASVEPQGLWRLVRDIRVVEKALGDGIKRVYESELPALRRLRRVRAAENLG